MERAAQLRRIGSERGEWDFVVVGGGATGMGIAVDAASRGYSVALFEQSDFGKGTSSRSTKLVHGGVRYLQQGNISLVMEALKERGLLCRNAPHLVRDLAFIVPNYDWWETPFYGIGMKVYDMLAGKYNFGKSRHLSKKETLERIPTLETKDLRGGVLYYDGQFDDARLLVNLAQTAIEQGAAVVNYAAVTGLLKNDEGFVSGVQVADGESGDRFDVPARCVINATGPFADGVRRMDEPGAESMIAPSQGVHIVVSSDFLAGESAIMVPRTSDGRVMFAIPWLGRTVIGTTDTPIDEPALEPHALESEIDFILETAAPYLHTDPTSADILSVFTGIRPLVKAGGGSTKTAALSREHVIQISRSGLLTIAGGKWTTYRRMAADCVDHAVTLAELDERPCRTSSLNIHGHDQSADRFGHLSLYGSDAGGIRALVEEDASLGERLDERLPITGAQIVWAARHEMARSVEDALSRRTRALLLDARAAMDVAERTASLLSEELGRDRTWRRTQVESFRDLARGYLVN